jgi:ADP-ribosyl-[dinitrogen reductase] hydrolase
MINTKRFTKKQTAMMGALIGDAMGVPHEFKHKDNIEPYFIDHPLALTDDYRSYAHEPSGVYSDDFSQQLCVAVNSIKPTHNKGAFYEDLLEWQRGKYWVNSHLFDEGIQTASQLQYYSRTGKVNIHNEQMSGNGSLMRILPVAFSASNVSELKTRVDDFGSITHNSPDCMNSCFFYCLLVKILRLSYIDFNFAWNEVIDQMDGWTPQREKHNLGSGYVIDTLMAVKDCIENTNSFPEAIKRAIMYGGDTDTNACVVGGIAALVFGLDDVPQEWFDFIQPSLENEYVQQLFGSNG